VRLLFTHPALAWAALGVAAMPLLIHLLNRRRAQLTYFPAVEFVLASTRRVARRERLKQILLLLARTLAVAGAAFAVARPFLGEPGAAPVDTGPPAAVALVLDDSASMTLEVRGETLYERALAAARSRVAALRAEDAAAVIFASSVPEPLPRPGAAGAALAELSADRSCSLSSAPLRPALEAAARVLAADDRPARRLVLFTDRAAHALSLESSPWPSGSEPPQVEIVDLGGPEAPSNLAVVAAVAEPAPDEGPRAFRVTATVAAHGPDGAQRLPVVLEVEGREHTRGFVDLEPGGRAQKEFLVHFDRSGILAARLRIETEDGLDIDDERPLALQVHRQLRLLLVDGAPSPIPHRDEVFYLERALDPTRGALGRLALSVVDPETLADHRFAAHDAVFLCNVPAEAISPVAGRLVDFVEQGGGLLVSVGDQVEPEGYTRQLGELLPAELGLVGAPVAGAPAPGVVLRPIAGHPVLDGLRGAGEAALSAVRVRRWLDVNPGSGRTVLLELDQGLPLLLEARHGRGRVLLLLSSLDRDWADLAISPAFLPLMQRIAEHLAHEPIETETAETLVGEVRFLPVPSGTSSLEIEGPAGERVTLGPDELAGARDVAYTRTRAPGVFRVRRDGRVADAFTVVLQPRESDLTRVPVAGLRQALGPAQGGGATVTAAASAPTRPLWSALLLLAAAMILLESVIRGRP